MHVLLDSKPLGLVTHPKANPEADECNAWLDGLLDQNVQVRVPEIIDYELRRKLIQLDKADSIAKLDYLAVRLGYLMLDTESYLIAAALWGKLRKEGQGTAPPERLDIDCLLAAQAYQAATRLGGEIRIATIDVDDLKRYDTNTVKAVFWKDIKA